MSNDHEELDFSLSGEVTKVSEELRVAYGWMSVTVDKGLPVIDQQGDIIETADLQQAVWKFMDTERVSATMHARDASGAPVRTGKFVDSIVITGDLAKAMGMDPDREGWFVGIQIEDDRTWARVKSGELAMFSIGGKARRTEVEIEVTSDE